MDKYTPINTREELARAVELGLEMQSAYTIDGRVYDFIPLSGDYASKYLHGAPFEDCFYDWTFRAVGEHDLTPAKPDGAFISGFGGWDAYLPGGRVLELKTGEPLAVGEHDLSPTNAAFNPGDTVRYEGKQWRVQGIDDRDPTSGLLLLDVAAPEDAPYFVDTAFPLTRGSNRRPKDGPGEYRWCWGSAEDVELVSRGESEAPDSDPDKPELLTNADFNPGDIVRSRGKKWRVQGIDDRDSTSGLLLLDVAEPEDAPDFVNAGFPVTRGIGRRPNGPGGRRWRWGSAGKAELVSRGEPGPAKPELKTEEPLAVGDLVRVARDWDDFGVVGPAYRARFLGVVGRIAKDDRGIDGTLGLSAPDGGPLNMDGALGLLWAHPAQLDRVEEQGATSVESEPEAPDSEPAEGVGAVEAPPAFLISVEIHADTSEGYAAAIEMLARGIES